MSEIEPYSPKVRSTERRDAILAEAARELCTEHHQVYWEGRRARICDRHGFLWEEGVPFCNDERAPLLWALLVVPSDCLEQ